MVKLIKYRLNIIKIIMLKLKYISIILFCFSTQITISQNTKVKILNEIKFNEIDYNSLNYNINQPDFQLILDSSFKIIEIIQKENDEILYNIKSIGDSFEVVVIDEDIRFINKIIIDTLNRKFILIDCDSMVNDFFYYVDPFGINVNSRELNYMCNNFEIFNEKFYAIIESGFDKGFDIIIKESLFEDFHRYLFNDVPIIIQNSNNRNKSNYNKYFGLYVYNNININEVNLIKYNNKRFIKLNFYNKELSNIIYCNKKKGIIKIFYFDSLNQSETILFYKNKTLVESKSKKFDSLKAQYGINLDQNLIRYLSHSTWVNDCDNLNLFNYR